MKDQPSMPDWRSSKIVSDCSKTIQRLPDTICILNETGVFEFVSSSGLLLFGYTPQEMLGKHISAFLHPDDLPETNHRMAHIFQTHSKTTDYKNHYIKKDGSIVPVNWSARWEEVDRLLYCVARDGSEKKALEERLDKAQKIARIGIFDYDLVSNCHMYLSESMFDIFGVPSNDREALNGGNFWNMIHPDDRESARANSALARMIASQQPVSKIECRIVRPSGEVAYVSFVREILLNNEGLPTKITGTVLDITEQKLGEQALEQSREKFRCLVQEGSDLITIIDKDCQLLFVSDNVRQILGYSATKILGSNANQLVHPDDVVMALDYHEQVMQNKAATSSVQHRFKHKNGQWVWLDAIGINHLHNPSIQGIVVVSRNIDERIQLQHTLEEVTISRQKEITAAVIQAQENERRALARELHDNVNQILTTVKLYNEMYLSQAAQDTSLLQKAVQYTQACINEIRSISQRLTEPTLEGYSLQEAITELADSINLAKTVTIHCEVDEIKEDNIPDCLYLAIYRIIQEGLTNIIKYAGAANAFIGLQKKGQNLHLIIQDNGTGFNPVLKPKGIGLTNMKTRAEQMNGRMRIDSAPGRGCTIDVIFPVEKE